MANDFINEAHVHVIVMPFPILLVVIIVVFQKMLMAASYFIVQYQTVSR